MIPEFIGRLPVVTALDALTEDELVLILTDTKNAMIKQYSKLLAMEGVNLTVTKDALRALAAAGREERDRRPRPALDARENHARGHVRHPEPRGHRRRHAQPRRRRRQTDRRIIRKKQDKDAA